MIGIEEIYPLAVEFRRYFHQHPEFAMQEVVTHILRKYWNEMESRTKKWGRD